MRIKNGKYEFISPAEQYDFEQDFPFLTNAQMLEKYKCSRRTVIRKARELNLQKDELFRYQFDFRKWGALGCDHENSKATRFVAGAHVSPSTEFKSGHTHWTKGKSLTEIYMHRYLQTIPAH